MTEEYIRTGNHPESYRKAVEAFTKAEEINPNYIEAWFHHGKVISQIITNDMWRLISLHSARSEQSTEVWNKLKAIFGPYMGHPEVLEKVFIPYLDKVHETELQNKLETLVLDFENIFRTKKAIEVFDNALNIIKRKNSAKDDAYLNSLSFEILYEKAALQSLVGYDQEAIESIKQALDIEKDNEKEPSQ